MEEGKKGYDMYIDFLRILDGLAQNWSEGYASEMLNTV